MDSTIRRILGERVGELEEPEVEASGTPEIVNDQAVGPEDAEVHELANLWTAGNKGEVVHRFMEMDNETSVKLVFAIGREGALELARVVDQRIEQVQEPEPEEVISNEPERIEPPTGKGYPVSEIIGEPAEVAA